MVAYEKDEVERIPEGIFFPLETCLCPTYSKNIESMKMIEDNENLKTEYKQKQTKPTIIQMNNITITKGKKLIHIIF